MAKKTLTEKQFETGVAASDAVWMKMKRLNKDYEGSSPTNKEKKKKKYDPKKMYKEARKSSKQDTARTHYQGGGRTNLLEELGRVEGESSNRNRRAEVSRIHGELNRGYKHGGSVGAAKRGFNKKILRS